MKRAPNTLKIHRDRAEKVLAFLQNRYPNPQTALDWNSVWELLAATMLSAQSTDKQVNKITPQLFFRFPTPQEAARADVSEIEEIIRSVGFFRQKAKSLRGTARMIVEEFNGKVPGSMDELLRLPGVARKTANIVLSNGFGVQAGIAVDTHVRRISRRLGLTESDKPEIIEHDLMPLFPKEKWGEVNHMLVYFGREVCTARKPRCSECGLGDICPKKGL